jgi:hypothetical protein
MATQASLWSWSPTIGWFAFTRTEVVKKLVAPVVDRVLLAFVPVKTAQ